LGWLLLPISHLRWLPELGTTRPLSSILFALAFIAIMLYKVLGKGMPRFSPPAIWSFLKAHLGQMPGWQFLRWWMILTFLGFLSAALTLFYGSFFQAMNRLLGYCLIFIYLYITLFSLQAYGIKTIALFTATGYIPILLYAVIEVLAILNIPAAYSLFMFVRNQLVVPFPWVSRLSLLTTEPSFVGFQLILLFTIFPFVTRKPYRLSIFMLFILALFFTQSATLIGLVMVYFVSLFLLTAKPRLLAGVMVAGGLAGITTWLFYSVLHEKILPVLQSINIHRLDTLKISLAIRWNYILNLIYVLLETRGLGLGIGQYGLYWKEIYLRHIEYQSFDKYGEVAKALASQEYMRPWSVVLGIGSDLGIVGILLFFAFIIPIFRLAKTAHERVLTVAAFFALLSAYPIVTPHVWLALALIGGRAILLSQEQVSTQ
jgi:hypothetical protein